MTRRAPKAVLVLLAAALSAAPAAAATPSRAQAAPHAASIRTHAVPASAWLRVCGTSPDERLAEVIELEDHPFFVASQFHPEFKSRPERPAPLFRGFIAAALERAAARDGFEVQDARAPAGEAEGERAGLS